MMKSTIHHQQKLLCMYVDGREKDEEAPLLLLWQVSLKVASAKVVKGADHFPSSTTTNKMRHYNLQFPHRATAEILRYFQIKLE